MRWQVWSPVVSGHRFVVADDLTRSQAEAIARRKRDAARKLHVDGDYVVTAENERPL